MNLEITTVLLSIIAGLLSFATAFYTFYMKKKESANELLRLEKAKNQISSYLQDKHFKMMSFERVRGMINDSYSDDFLVKLIESFPNQFRHAKLKGNKRGIARLVEEEEAEDV